MKKLLHLSVLVLLCGTFSSFKNPEPIAKERVVKASKKFSQYAGTFNKNGYTFGVWVTAIPGTVTDVYNTGSGPSVTYFSGNINSAGVLRVNVELSNGTTFFYSGYLTP